jgi:hypothetical protein
VDKRRHKACDSHFDLNSKKASYKSSCLVSLECISMAEAVKLRCRFDSWQYRSDMFPGSRTRVSYPEDVAPRHTLKGSGSDLLRGAIEVERLV